MTSGLETEFLTLHEFVKAARFKLTPYIWDYLVGGTETETTLRRNRQSLDQIAFRPRVLRNVAKIDAGTKLLGRPTRLPVLLAPIGSLESFDAGAGVTVAKAASAFGVPLMLSSVTTLELEKVAEAGTGTKIYQLYTRGDRAWVDERVRRVTGAGFDALCVTVDSALYSRRERDIARRFAKPWVTTRTGMDHQAAFSWDDVKHLKDTLRIPLMLKGIATAEDAAIACEHGVDFVYVSNHGGRQLDHGRGAIEVLPEVMAAVAGRARVIIDSGFCRGTDVVKALALGAEAVGIGRLYCYGLAAAGEAGIVRVLEILEEEIEGCLGLIGLASFEGLDKSYLHQATPTTPPHVHSSFPLLDLEDEGY
jgi:isopentenyl diphosphate isomerase/L-lactate dehydrogenase-like FMN-dependent dehydrogenase